MTVSLREITAASIDAILALQVAPSQAGLVASNANSIAKSLFERERVWLRGVYADDSPVGFLALWDDAEAGDYHLLRFMIDGQHQGKGYGARAIALLLDYVRQRPGARKLSLFHSPKDGHAGPFYQKLGFAYTGERDGDELIMHYAL